MATREQKAKVLELAKKGADNTEDQRFVTTEIFKNDGKYTFDYVKQHNEFSTRNWMLENFTLKIKKRYNTRIQTLFNFIKNNKPDISFYCNLLQNTAAEIWFEETYNIDLTRQDFKVKCLSHFKLNRMEHKWIIVGQKNEYSSATKFNNNDVPIIMENLIFVTYFPNTTEFVFWGAVTKTDYNKAATFGSAKYDNPDKIFLPTELFDDREFAKNPITKDLLTRDQMPVKKTQKKRKYPMGKTNIIAEKLKNRRKS